MKYILTGHDTVQERGAYVLVYLNGRRVRVTTVPPVADIVCSAGSLLQCHVRRHCHAKIKAKIGCYAILHATFADYIRLNISHHILLFDSEKWMNK